jgi:AcrR family transcriptional regulator
MPRWRREEQILAAAVEEFSRHGYANVSMADIAVRVGVTKPLLYQYFGSKDGLYAACVGWIGEPLGAAITAAMTEPTSGPASGPGSTMTPPGIALAVLRAVFTTLEDRRHAWFLLYDRTLPDGGAPAEAARRYREVIDRLATTGTRQALGPDGPDDAGDPLDADALKQLWIGVVGSLVVWWTRHPEQSADDMAARCERLFAAVLGRGRG